MTAAPLVVTLLLDEAAQARFDDLRRRHFPPERNHLAAHVTLFHALPSERSAEVLRDVSRATARAPFPVAVTRVRFLGRGVAYDLAAPELDALRAELAAAWAPWLTPQDSRRFAAHVTVQNKVDPERARALHAELAAAPPLPDATATGVAVWRYLGGPWEAVAASPLRGD
ncbi:2'-5' RNA ligase [Kineococcus xinjiangensis]|uniref:2'-5' RNA ligase n=1 Tax=Kineococcus xinjiangensis TaxID=512762 RepID=A0A2S6ISW3_9ACTN|nr:2'-5' RNA ligase family protein [Kineococcus xinjiangensis]PPK97337.1 2'-5' RNA ligase [Kineococcus xinjiangensis]